MPSRAVTPSGPRPYRHRFLMGPRLPACHAQARMSSIPRGALPWAVLILSLLGGADSGASQVLPPAAASAFLDAQAEATYRAARSHWASLNQSVLGYVATIRQRLAMEVRAPSRDRTLFRQESAVRVWWDQEQDALIQVLAARRQFLAGQEPWHDGEDWLNALTFEYPFRPGGERLFFGMEDQLRRWLFPGEDEFWLVHPLAPGGDSLFQYRSGDTLTLSLPDGRAVRSVELHVLPRKMDPRLITGILSIDPTGGELMRAVYRPSRPLNAATDLPELREGTADTRLALLPGFARPWTIDLHLVVMDYTLWDHRVWMPRSMLAEGEARAGQVTFPFTMDVTYDIASVVLAGTEHLADQIEIPDGPFTDRDGIAYELIPQERRSGDRRSRILVPEDRALLASGPYLPPPIRERGPQFATREELLEIGDHLQGVRDMATARASAALSWGWGGHDLLRYNRVEGLAVGGRLQGEIGGWLGPVSLTATVFLGFSDREPKARLGLERRSARRRVELGLYRELRSMHFRGRDLALGNSLNAFLLGRDYGDYYQATGMDLLWRSPAASRTARMLRLYGEDQRGRETRASFSLAHALREEWAFRPNQPGDAAHEAGAEIFFAPGWGTDPTGIHVGLELYGQGAFWESADRARGSAYARAGFLARLALSPATGPWRVGMEVAGGTTLGEATRQRQWLLGGPGTLRGFDAGVLAGSSFARGRLELARSFPLWGLGAFGDAGWAGAREELRMDRFLFGAGLGVSVLDGLLRVDLCRGLSSRDGEFRFEVYLDGIL